MNPVMLTKESLASSTVVTLY